MSVFSVEEIRDITKDTFVGNGVRRAFLFGSYAWGIPNEKSDVDICAEFEREKSFLESCGLLYELREKLGRDVDFFNVSEFRSQPELLRRVEKDGICIYER